MTPRSDAPSDFRMPMSRVFSRTIIEKMARMQNPATPTIMKSSKLRSPRSMSTALSSEPCFSSQVDLVLVVILVVSVKQLFQFDDYLWRVGIVLELDLDVRDPLAHDTQPLQVGQRDVHKVPVVFGHLGLD